MHTVSIKRIYEPFSKEDGTRILVDRLWPRGISKEKANINLWLKDIAPSNELRKEFHTTNNWDEFEKRYIAELKGNTDAVASLEEVLKKGNVTLLFGSKNTEHNNAVVLLEFLKAQK